MIYLSVASFIQANLILFNIQADRAQPDAAAAMAISGEMDSEIITAKYSHGPHVCLFFYRLSNLFVIYMLG